LLGEGGSGGKNVGEKSAAGIWKNPSLTRSLVTRGRGSGGQLQEPPRIALTEKSEEDGDVRESPSRGKYLRKKKGVDVDGTNLNARGGGRPIASQNRLF